MNKLKKILFVVMIAIFSAVFCSEVYASESTNDGLVINLTTDKDEYKKGESISLDLSVKNTNDYSIRLLEIQNAIPQGFSADEKTSSKLENQEIRIGDTVHLRTSITENKHDVIGKVGSIDTGDSTHIKNIATMMGISAILLFIIFVIKYKSFRKSASLLLVIGIAIASTVTSIQATDISNEVTIEKEIIYDGNKFKVNGSVTYETSYQDPKEPIEYQEGVKESKLNYQLDEENMRVITSETNAISNWNKGEIHVLKNTMDPTADIAIIVESIEPLNDGSAVIVYSKPDLSAVIKSIDYSGFEEQTGVLIPAEGITFTEENSMSSKGRSAKHEKSKGTFDLFKKKTFTYKKDGIQFGGELCVERLNYDFRANVDLSGINFEKGYVTLESSVKLGLEVNYKGKKEIKIASFEAPIGYGFFAVGDIYCYFTANGEIVLEYTINATSGFDYENDSLKGIWELENKLSKAKANVNLKVGCVVEPKVSLLKIGLIGGEFDFGRDYELKLDEISLEPLEYCIDAGYFNYASISAVLLPGTWDKKYTVSLFDENDSPIREKLHIEEGKIVDDCTRKLGSLEGTILKQDGENKEPLYLADITLEKDGKVKYSTKSQSEGKFYFDKQVEKGTYDILVRSNKYETYKATVVVKGNRHNKIEEPIVLYPYAESVTITGNVYDIDTNFPISNATVSVEGYEDRSTITNVDGNYSLAVPKGSQKIIVDAKNYNSNVYSSTFEVDNNNINIGLKKADEKGVFTINEGESYQLKFNSSKRIFVKAEENSEYSSFLDGDTTYHRKRNTGDEFYRDVNSKSYWEIKVFSGSLSIYASDGSFGEGPDSNLSDYCSFTNMNGIDPFITYKIASGDSKTFDNKVDYPKSKSFTIHCFSNEIVKGTEAVTDYYYNEHFGWEISNSIYELENKRDFWRPINNLEKVKLAITQGEMTVYYYRLDELTVY